LTIVQSDHYEQRKNHDSRIAIRISKNEKQKITSFIKKGEANNVSQIVRVAVREFLESRRSANATK
jgi:Arc/MetJ-type ribon-helix-helix transcriptional regulator